jgi:acetyl-CoA carboxylase biotin carboxyl carrier protein
MDITSRDIVAILKTIQELGYRHFRLQQGDLLLEVDADSGRMTGHTTSALAAPSAGAPVAATSLSTPGRHAEQPPKAGAVAVRAPMTGTFYHAPASGAAPFVEVGVDVRSDQIVCIVEVMKLFNSIPAGVTGRVVEICLENESPVSAGQVVMWIDPR